MFEVEREIIERVRAGESIDEIGCSCSEEITVRLALGLGHLPHPYEAETDAWNRMDERQRRIVIELNPAFGHLTPTYKAE